jgi:hypothetical protein
MQGLRPAAQAAATPVAAAGAEKSRTTSSSDAKCSRVAQQSIFKRCWNKFTCCSQKPVNYEALMHNRNDLVKALMACKTPNKIQQLNDQINDSDHLRHNSNFMKTLLNIPALQESFVRGMKDSNLGRDAGFMINIVQTLNKNPDLTACFINSLISSGCIESSPLFESINYVLKRNNTVHKYFSEHIETLKEDPSFMTASFRHKRDQTTQRTGKGEHGISEMFSLALSQSTFKDRSVFNLEGKKIIGDGFFGVVELLKPTPGASTSHEDTAKKTARYVKKHFFPSKKDNTSELLSNKLTGKFFLEITEPTMCDGKIENFTQEYFDGQTLADTQLNPISAGKVSQKMLEAVISMHTQNVAHLDLHDENVLVKQAEQEGEYDLKIIDFGLAKVLEKCRPEEKATLIKEDLSQFLNSTLRTIYKYAPDAYEAQKVDLLTKYNTAMETSITAADL